MKMKLSELSYLIEMLESEKQALLEVIGTDKESLTHEGEQEISSIEEAEKLQKDSALELRTVENIQAKFARAYDVAVEAIMGRTVEV